MMFSTRRKTTLWLLLLLLFLAACQPETVTEIVEVTRVVTETITETIIEEGETVIVEVEAAPSAAPAPTAVSPNQPAEPNAAATPVARLIIKDGRMTIIVEDTEAAVDRAIGLTIDLGGYIIRQRVYNDADSYRFATLKLAVPVLTFEDAMRSLRTLGDVTDESASGDDVTEEFTDLNSQLTNLKATRDRLRDFLDQAETIEQSLEVNEELKKIEEEIAIIEGRLNFLRDRAAFSTISLTINPWIPTATPSPTATFTPSPTPTKPPTPEVWRPADTAKTAAVELQNTGQNTADFLIYTGIVCGPWLLLTAVLAFIVWKIANYWTSKRSGTPSRKEADDE